MLKFKEFLAEATIDAGGMKKERYRQSYIEPYVGSDDFTHTTAKKAGSIEPGSRVRIHKVEDISNRTHVHLEDEHGNQTIAPSSVLNKPKTSRQDPTFKEQGQIETLRSQLRKAQGGDGSKPMRIRVGKHVIDDAIDIVKANKKLHSHAEELQHPREPKADAVILSKSGQHLFLSLKDGTEPKHFLQLGGVSEPSMSIHPAVKRLHNAVQQYKHQVGSRLPTTLSSSLDMNNPEDVHFFKKATYGLNYGTGRYGMNNVHALVQGDNIHLSHQNGELTLNATHIHHNGEIPEEYNPITKEREKMKAKVFARNASNRNDLGLKDTRVGVIADKSRKSIDVSSPEFKQLLGQN